MRNHGYKKYLKEKHSKLNTSPEAIEYIIHKATGSTIINHKRIIIGEVNEVYEVITKDKKNYIVRISRSKFPRFEAEKKVINLAKNAGVLAPTVLLVERMNSSGMDVTLCVEEKINGQPLNTILETIDKKSLESILMEAGSQLSKIHSIQVDNFGNLDRSDHYKNWESFILRSAEKVKRFSQLAKIIQIDLHLMQKANKILRDHSCLYKEITPYLLHGDFSLKHLLISRNHIVGIIDFESAKGGDPLFDFAWLDYFYGERIPMHLVEKGYSNKKIFDDNYELKMSLYSIHLGLGFIDYYESEKNMPALEYAKQKLLKELSNFGPSKS